MNNYSLSWVIGVGEQVDGGNKKLPTWKDIEYYLDKIKVEEGSLTLSIVNGPEPGPQTLQILADEGKYVLSLGEDNGIDYIVRSYWNPELKDSEHEILGNIWNGEQLCLDFSIVKEALEEFFIRGDVSLKLLS